MTAISNPESVVVKQSDEIIKPYEIAVCGIVDHGIINHHGKGDYIKSKHTCNTEQHIRHGEHPFLSAAVPET